MRRWLLGIAPLLLLLASGCGGGGGGGGGSTTASGGGGGTTAGGGASASPVPIYVLVGGGAVGALGDDVYGDGGELDPGEVFVMAKDPLLASSTYRVDYTLIAGGITYTGSWQFSTGTATVTTAGATGAVAELNAFRAQAGAPAVTADGNYATSATRHAGYQCETGSITHDEPTSAADFFINNDFWRRISIANGGSASSNSWGGSNIVYETIATNGDEAAIDLLWDTVYHRVAMMRRHVTRTGAGDRTEAMLDSIYIAASPKPFTGSGNANQQFMTLDYGGNTTIAQVLARWPADLQAGVGTTFLTDQESPDPVGGGNGTPTDNAVGTPIHLVLPTSAAFTTITVALTKL